MTQSNAENFPADRRFFTISQYNFARGAPSNGARLGIRMYTGYGMSETCPLLSATHIKPGDLELPLDQQTSKRIKTGVSGCRRWIWKT